MERVDIRTLDSANGRKVLHPRDSANTLFAILTFIFAAFPVLFFFIYSIANDPAVNGLDIMKYAIDIIKSLATGGTMPPDTNLTLQLLIYLIQTHLPQYADVAPIMIIILAALMWVMCLLSAILILISIVHLAKGYLKKTTSVIVITAVQFVLAIAYFVILIVFYSWMAQVPGTTQPLVIWFTIVPMVVALLFLISFGIIHGTKFSGAILESEIELVDSDAETQPVVEAQPAQPVVKDTPVEQNAVIPANTTSIGGHAYAENQKITVANIPLAVNKLGAGAFANCLKLRVVSIPKSVIEIGENCFFNCVSLERINYAGTKMEWSKIKRGSNWLARAKTTEVVCSDSVIVVDPYK